MADDDMQRIALILTPKPDPKTGLHSVVEIVSTVEIVDEGEEEEHTEFNDTEVRVRFPSDSRGEKGGLDEPAHFDASDTQEIDDEPFARSHSPGAGLNYGPHAGRGFGFALYAGLTLHAASDRWNFSGIFSPEGGASRSAEQMWNGLVNKVRVAKVEAVEGQGKRTYVEHCEPVGDREREDDDGRVEIDADEVCARVPATRYALLKLRYLTPDALIRNGWIAEWDGTPKIQKSRLEAFLRADLGPAATPEDYFGFAKLLRTAAGEEAMLQFIRRPDVLSRIRDRHRLPGQIELPGASDDAHIRIQGRQRPGSVFHSGHRSSAPRLSSLSQLTPAPLPSPSSAYRRYVAEWDDIDF